jgi:diguanylate cyclase (GGDEF)-like protein/PAS domain S-box-containing protein
MIDEMIVEPDHIDGSHEEYVAVLDAGGTIVSCTPALCALLGYGIADLAGRDIRSLIAERERRGGRTVLADAGASGFAEGLVAFSHRGGPDVPLIVRRSPYLNGKGEALSFLEFRADGTQTLSRAAREADAFADADPNPVLRVARDGTLLYANHASWMLLAAWSARIGSAVPAEWVRTVREALDRAETAEAETRTGLGFVHVTVVPSPDHGYANLYGIDTTRRRRAEEKLRLSAKVLDNARDASLVLDSDLRIVEVNRGFLTITGRSREEVLGESAPSAGVALAAPEIWAAVRARGSWEGAVRGTRKDGAPYPAWALIESMGGGAGDGQGFIVVLSDMTAIRHAEEQLFRLAHSDGLTGLANRRAFLDALERDLQAARREDGDLTVLRLDLDRFALVNDDLGTSSGDKALCEIAGRIQRVIRTGDTVARADGDEFLVALRDVPSSAAESVAAKVRLAISEPMTIEGHEILVTASAGSASFPGAKADGAGLLSAAGIALRRAKESGRNAHIPFTPVMETRSGEQVLLQTRIRRALREGEFVVHYQPQVDVGRGAVSGLEALVRWQNASQGLVGPGSFVPFAEESGQIWEIGAHVLRVACLHGKLWQDGGAPPVQIGVNVSPRQLAHPGFVGLVETVLRETGFPPRRLELELTEGALIEDDVEILRKLRALRGMGLSLAIDDFGTRYSTFSYLKRLPVNRLKIDASFIKDMGEGSAGTRIVAAIIAMGHSLQMEVVAEGVETDEQVALLRDLGCGHLQGFYFGRPQPAASVADLLGAAPRFSRSGTSPSPW